MKPCRVAYLIFPAIAILFNIVCSPSALAKLMPHRTMVELIGFSDLVVYCDEKDVQTKDIPHGSWTETITVVKCRVLNTIKGDAAPGTEFTVNYDDLFCRYPFGSGAYTETDAAGKVIAVHKAVYLPAGRALMFLRKDDTGAYQVVSAKLVQDGQVLQFIQMMNPGPLNTEPQQPENIKLAAGQHYGEKELLEDAVAASKKADQAKRQPQNH